MQPILSEEEISLIIKWFANLSYDELEKEDYQLAKEICELDPNSGGVPLYILDGLDRKKEKPGF